MTAGSDMTGIARHRMTLCPHCGHVTDAVGSHDGSPDLPKPGDLGVCIACAGVVQLGPDGLPTLPALGSVDAMRLADPEAYRDLLQAQESVRRVGHVIGPPGASRRSGRA